MKSPLTGIVAVCLLVLLVPPASGQSVWHVKASAPPGGDGLSWSTAFDSLQDALDVAAVPDQVWVARGRYRPDRRLTPADPRSVTFWVPNGVNLYGGFAGNETSLEERAGTFQSTHLSGDVGVPGDSSDNAYHVVYLAQTQGIPATSDIDGFVISNGRADFGTGPSNHNGGGGIRCDNSGLRLANCTFRDNFALRGGAIHQQLGAIRVKWCTFEENRAIEGGALYLRFATLFLFNSTLRDNSAINEGGAVFVNTSWTGSSILVSSCELYDNSAARGAAVYVRAPAGPNSPPSNSTWVNCTIAYNTATEAGGAFFDEPGGLTPPKTRVVGSILWANAAPLGAEIMGSLSKVKQCTVTGGYPGANLSLDPRFLDGRARLFQLLPSSPCIDAANNNFAPKDLADLDGDKNYSEPAPLDHGRYPRYVDHPVPDTGVGSGALMDMGAHEAQADD